MKIYGSLPLQRFQIVLDYIFPLEQLIMFNLDEKVVIKEVVKKYPFPTYIVEEYDPNYFQNSINHFKFLVKYNLVV